ncbi:MAG: phosphonate C-P lyase system protein PhnL [Desulfovibrionales bacterium]|nr:MAG: phosphonate C-P lyase system protein PhnL [Desulfovibrionales bacterium]
MTTTMALLRIRVQGLGKSFVLHHQGGVRINVFQDLDLQVAAGECLALAGASGTGKSSLLRSLYGNYKPDMGSIFVLHENAYIDLASAPPRWIQHVRRGTIAYVSQFLRVIPRVSAVDIVTEAAQFNGRSRDLARQTAQAILSRLNIGPHLWSLAPKTFSGGEQQRVNIARGFARECPVLLLDEPTASLDAENRDVVIRMILEAKATGTAVVGIFHDEQVRSAVADRIFTMPGQADAPGKERSPDCVC